MALHLLLFPLDEEDCGQNQKSAGERREPDVAEVIAQEDEQCDQAETEPARQSAEPLTETHKFVSVK
jgi:hypothetical protein